MVAVLTVNQLSNDSGGSTPSAPTRKNFLLFMKNNLLEENNMITSKVGLEAEFLLQDAKGNFILPNYLPHDDFPLLGEVRGEEGTEAYKTLGNFAQEFARVRGNLRKGHQIIISSGARIPLALYKAATRACSTDKGDVAREVRNIYGIDISDFSDQIIKKNKIQGLNASCGLHVHFSAENVDSTAVYEDQYESLSIPLSHGEGLKTEMRLYKKLDYKKDRVLKARASLLTRPVIEWMVKQMDDKFFTRFIPKVPTKYRQPGFFELKPYGFEYRSLPFTEEVDRALPEITEFAFKLLDSLNDWSVKF